MFFAIGFVSFGLDGPTRSKMFRFEFVAAARDARDAAWLVCARRARAADMTLLLALPRPRREGDALPARAH